MSFSGMKSAVRRAIEQHEPLTPIERPATRESESTLRVPRALSLSSVGRQMSNALPTTADWALRSLAAATHQPRSSSHRGDEIALALTAVCVSTKYRRRIESTTRRCIRPCAPCAPCPPSSPPTLALRFRHRSRSICLLLLCVVDSVSFLRQLAVIRHLQHRLKYAIEWCERRAPNGNRKIDRLLFDFFETNWSLLVRSFIVTGGVARNEAITRALGNGVIERGWSFAVPPPQLCTDNGVMVCRNCE